MGEITLDNVTKEFPGGVTAVDNVQLTIDDGEFMVLVGPSGCGKTTLLRSIGGLEKITGGRILINEKDVTRAAPGARDIAMVFQNYALYPHMTVRQNLGYGLRVRKTPKGERNKRVEEVATLLGLDGLLDRRPRELSGGQIQRVAVMRDGKLQQVDVPQRLYEEPSNLFVAAFIGSPAMNLARATLTEDTVSFGGITLPLDRERRPAAAQRDVIVGVRPEAFEDAAFADGSLPQIEVRVAVLEELGADAHVFFEVDAEPVVVEEAQSNDERDETTILAEFDRTLFTARVDPRTTAKVGETLRLAVEPSRLYFFSPDTGESLLSAGRAALAG